MVLYSFCLQEAHKALQDFYESEYPKVTAKRDLYNSYTLLLKHIKGIVNNFDEEERIRMSSAIPLQQRNSGVAA